MARKQPAARTAQPASQTGLVNKPEATAKPAAVAKGGAKLDRDKKFYPVHGGGNVKFEQDGKLFNLEGNQVDLDGNLIKDRVSRVSPTSDIGDADPDALTSGSVGAVGDPVIPEPPPADNDHVAPGAEPFPEFPADANGGNPDAEKTDGMTEDDLAALGGK